MLPVQQLGQRGGSLVQRLRPAITFQYGKLKDTAQQRCVQAQVTRAQNFILPGKMGASFIDEHINPVLGEFDIIRGEELEMALSRDTVVELAVAAHSCALSQ